MKRVLTALILVPIVTWLCLWAPKLVLLAATAAVATLCFREFRRLAGAHGMFVSAPLGYAAGLLFLLIPSVDIGLMFLILGFAIVLAMQAKDLKSVLPSGAALVFGVLYVYGAWRCGVELRVISPHMLLYSLSINWIGDMAAYATGTTMGRHKLAPRVSPGKSWEGFFGSVVVSTAYGAGFLQYFQPTMPIYVAASLSVVANIAGQLGDLAESAIKRGAGMKDSGTMLPGHGGWLDRVDSSLFTLPVVYFLLKHLQ